MRPLVYLRTVIVEMLVTRLLESESTKVVVTEFSDFSLGLDFVLGGGLDQDFGNMTLLEMDTSTNIVGRTYDGQLLEDIVNGRVNISSETI